MKTPLALKMIARANEDGLTPDHPLRLIAIDFDAKTQAAFGRDPPEGSAMAMYGAWARARKTWMEYSGEVLV